MAMSDRSARKGGLGFEAIFALVALEFFRIR